MTQPAISRHRHEELEDTDVRVRAFLPGAVSSRFWEESAVDLATFPAENVMTVNDAVDASLTGLDAGEHITIPSLPDEADWDTYDAQRRVFMPQLSRKTPPRATATPAPPSNH
jgi:short-subunit dehydrogenase